MAIKVDKKVELVKEILKDMEVSDSDSANKAGSVLQILMAEEAGFSSEDNKDQGLEIKIPSVHTHLSKLTSAIVNILMPSNRVYGSVESTRDGQSIGNQVSTTLNRWAKSHKHRYNVAAIVYDALAYNIGVGVVESNDLSITSDEENLNQDNLLEKTNTKITREGMAIKRLHPWEYRLVKGYRGNDYASEAKAFTYFEGVSAHEVLIRINSGHYVVKPSVKKMLENNTLPKPDKYRANPPAIPNRTKVSKKDKSCRPLTFFTTDNVFLDPSPKADHEITTVYMHTTGQAIGLGSGKEFQEYKLYKIVWLNDTHLLYAGSYTDSNGKIPMVKYHAKELMLGCSSPSLLEDLAPAQSMLNLFSNIHLNTLNGNRYHGLTFLGPNFPEVNLKKMTAGIIRADTTPNSGSLRDSIVNFPTSVPTASGIQGADFASALMAQMAPTDSVDRLSTLSRPVSHQTQSIIAEATLPILTMARDAHLAIMLPAVGFMVDYLIKSDYTVTVMTEQGEEVRGLEEYTDLPDVISITDGLRGLDTVAMTQQLMYIFQYALQNTQITQEYDIMALANYLLQIGGASIDLQAFKTRSQFDNLTPEQKDAALQLLQQAMQDQQNPNQ